MCDQRFILDLDWAGGEAREPSRALSVIGKEAVHIGADDMRIDRNRAFGRAVVQLREGQLAIRTRGHTHMHFVAGDRYAVEGPAVHRFEPLVPAEHRLHIEQAQALDLAGRPFYAAWVADHATQHLV